MFGFSPLRCLPVLSRSRSHSHSPSLSALSGTLSSPPAKQYGTWPGQNHMLIHVHKWRCMRICASAAALRPFIFISFVRTPCHGCRSNPQTKYSLSLSLCAVHPWLSSEILVTMVAIPPMAICVRQLPLFPLFPFLHFQFPPPYVIWLRSLLRSPVAQPTTHSPHPTSRYPYASLHTPHVTGLVL